MNLPLDISSGVAAAREEGKPIVALETAIVSHGLPYPDNVETVLASEEEIKRIGALAASIAVIEGRIRVGLDTVELERMATSKNVVKLSRSDISLALAGRWTGSTTVSATMICSRLAGIQVFATGGIGGVHRGAEISFDVSADLIELANSPVVVVASGAKAILDIPKTLEFLETLGVPAIAFGQNYFPGFWSKSSGYRAPYRFDSPADIANSFRLRRDLGIRGGILVANPVPAENALPLTEINQWIDRALQDLDARQIRGKSVTPFLLERIAELSDGRSLKANKDLIKSNASLAAQIAINLNQTNVASPASAFRSRRNSA
ncbi:MAG: pseudouridine-5'-phosphate glycosidase [Albidovulum sp.]|nr:pseudouridine-5'-phosphate glycosidase [Albidovulum sp.]MDE0532332.1 pseudouridine-5'-phosphate glycosidase [Albidovulum sp.]